MFNTIRAVDYYELEKEVIKRVGENKFSKELDRYLFEGWENSYNRITIECLKEDICDAKEGYSRLVGDEIEDYVKTWGAIIEIFEDEGIGETEDVVVWICW